MNREIKFRAWDAQLGEMYTPQFPYIGAGSSARDIAIMINGTVITPSSYDLDVFSALKPSVPELILMQFTGLKDKNGVDVYEGDIIDYGHGRHWKVIFRAGFYEIEGLQGMPWLIPMHPVIGNIYEHPHLIK